MLAYIAAISIPEDRTRAMALCGGGSLIGLTTGPCKFTFFILNKFKIFYYNIFILGNAPIDIDKS